VIDLGDVYRIRVPVKDPAGTLVDPATATLTITLPDGTTTAPAVNLPPADTGIVIVDYPTTQAGRHQFVLTTTDPQTAFRDVFDVRQAELANIVSLAETKNHLNITNDGDDAELRGFIEAVTSIIAFHVGALFPQEYVETYQANGPTIPLRHYPVTEVASIEPIGAGGSSVDPVNVDVDELGVLRLTSGQCIRGNYRITYTAGFTLIPANYTRAALIIIQHMWDTQRPRNTRQPSVPRSEDFSTMQDQSGRFYSVPRRAVELLQGSMQGGVA
jgi:hypothetical protein